MTKKAKREYDRTHREQINARRRALRLECKEKIRAQARKYKKNYKLTNKEKALELRNAYYKRRIATNPERRMKGSLRTRLYSALNGINKSASTMKLLGCSIEELKVHLQNKFVDNMHWNNYGMWHIDHIKPCASFNLLDPEEQKKCFHYTNLQPLWAEDNIKKSDNIMEGV